jgi:hypothetical protein
VKRLEKERQILDRLRELSPGTNDKRLFQMAAERYIYIMTHRHDIEKVAVLIDYWRSEGGLSPTDIDVDSLK